MKKVLSLVLAVVLVLGLGAVAFGKTNTNHTVWLGVSKVQDQYHPGDKIRVDMTIDGENVTREMVRKDKIDVRLRATEGSGVLDSYKIKYDEKTGTGRDQNTAYIEVKLVDPFVSTKDVDFNFRMYLTEDKSRLTDYEFNLTGNFENFKTTVDEYDDHVYLGDTPVVEADDYIRNIEVEVGQDLFIHTKMFDGKKYYGHVSQEVKSEDEAILAAYPDIETVYYLQTIGLASTGEIVELRLDSNFYVYTQDEEGNLVYIGRSKDRLPYYTKYYLSSKELDVDVVIEDGGEVIVPSEPEEPPVMGGDGETPANVNDNPGTGR